MHVCVCVVMRRGYRGWRNCHRKSLALGMGGVRPGQGVCWRVIGGLWGHLVAARGRRARGRAPMTPQLELAFGRSWGRLVELDGDVTGGFGRAAPSLWWGPGAFWVEILAAVVAAVRQAGAVECWVGAVHLLLGVALHKQVD